MFDEPKTAPLMPQIAFWRGQGQDQVISYMRPSAVIAHPRLGTFWGCLRLQMHARLILLASDLEPPRGPQSVAADAQVVELRLKEVSERSHTIRPGLSACCRYAI